MVDFHTHILPGIDDGAKDINQAMELFNEAKQAGFNKIILTSHYMQNLCIVSHKEREQIKNLIQNNLGISQMGLELYLGSEIYYSSDIVKDIKEKKSSTINESRYVLFELPISTEALDLYDVIYLLQSNKMVPILAHPERYMSVQKNIKIVEELVRKGVLMQCNYGSIIGIYGKEAQKLIKALLKSDLVHFLGSDIHRPKTIYPKIKESIKKIKKVIGEEKFRIISEENPIKVLRNENIV